MPNPIQTTKRWQTGDHEDERIFPQTMDPRGDMMQFFHHPVMYQNLLRLFLYLTPRFDAEPFSDTERAARVKFLRVLRVTLEAEANGE